MSSHYIYVRCPVLGCEASGTIYTGSVEVDGFPDSEWEGQTIGALCDDHAGDGAA